MIDDYIEVFSFVIDQIHRGAFKRPSGILQPPPAEVNGVGIFSGGLTAGVRMLLERQFR